MNHARFLPSATTSGTVLTFLLAPLICLGGDRVNMDIKLGLWETKVTTTNSGMPEMPAEMKSEMEQAQKRMNESMKSMTPEQRAKVEGAMKALTKPQSQPTQQTNQHCITKETMDQGEMLSGKEGMENCKPVLLQNDSRKLVMKMICTESRKAQERGKGLTTATGAGEILLKYTVLSSTNVKATMDMKMDVGGGKSFSSHSDIEETWLEADCHGKK